VRRFETLKEAGKLRADAERNRERVIATAKITFRQVGADASLNEIAQNAGVGIGTLYRHFPTRAALIEEVYRREVEHLALSARDLLENLPAEDALENWLKLAVDYIATKKIIAPAIAATEVYGSAGTRIVEALFLLVERAVEAGSIREDVTPEDVLRSLVGFTYGYTDADWQSSALRLIDILMRGLRR
jgi:AcrR family transcriptional regulator